MKSHVGVKINPTQIKVLVFFLALFIDCNSNNERWVEQTCDRERRRVKIWFDWPVCSCSVSTCLIFSFSMATVLKADFRRECTATNTHTQVHAESLQTPEPVAWTCNPLSLKNRCAPFRWVTECLKQRFQQNSVNHQKQNIYNKSWLHGHNSNTVFSSLIRLILVIQT